ncbi:MAG: AAA family ATPase [bacterium]
MKTTPYQILVVGMPGRGKTMSFRNLDPNTTGFINLEKKPLPFINKFKHYSTPNNWQECYQKLIEYAKNSEIETVVFESFSSYVDSLIKTARDTKKGFDVFNLYNTEIGNLQNLFKLYPKNIIVTAHYEWIETPEGAVEKRVSVKGEFIALVKLI